MWRDVAGVRLPGGELGADHVNKNFLNKRRGQQPYLFKKKWRNNYKVEKEQ
jgi:hypothetical protein